MVVHQWNDLPFFCCWQKNSLCFSACFFPGAPQFPLLLCRVFLWFTLVDLGCSMVALLSASCAAGRSGTGRNLPQISPFCQETEVSRGQQDQGEGFVVLGWCHKSHLIHVSFSARTSSQLMSLATVSWTSAWVLVIGVSEFWNSLN